MASVPRPSPMAARGGRRLSRRRNAALPMRTLSLLALAALAIAAAPAPVAAQQPPAGPVLLTGGALAPVEPPLPPYGRPLFPPLTLDGGPGATAVIAEPDMPDSGDGDALADAAPVLAAAAPASGSAGEPVLNGDYWLNFFWDIPRLFTAPARFDTGDWIKTGAFVAAAGAAFAADEDLRRFFRHNRSHVSDAVAAVGYRLGDAKSIVGGAALAYAAGYAAGDAKSRETALLVLQGWALSAGATEGVKRLSGRKRPGTSDDHLAFEGPSGADKSFWSGHVAYAFSTAAVVSEQYRDEPWVAPVAYGLAGLVAWSRLNDNAHWASDVVVAAGAGYAIGKLVAHFSPFRDRPDMTLSPWGLPAGGGLQLGFRF